MPVISTACASGEPVCTLERFRQQRDTPKWEASRRFLVSGSTMVHGAAQPVFEGSVRVQVDVRSKINVRLEQRHLVRPTLY